jgi:hypothetical protein
VKLAAAVTPAGTVWISFMLYADYYMSHTLICEVCGHDFKRWDKVCNHTLDTGHNAYNVGEPTHHTPPKTSASRRHPQI